MTGSLLDILFPPVCPLCEERLRDGHLCGPCTRGFQEKSITGPCCTTCGTPFQSGAQTDHACADCVKEEMPFKKARSAFYFEGAVLDAVHLLKYNGNVTLAPALGRLAASAASFSPVPDIVMPVPLHIKRLRSRGFNQSLLLAKEVAKALSLRMDSRTLRRSRDTAQQTRLKAEERRSNIAGAFEVAEKGTVEGKRVLVVDDVFTTGSTIRECSKVLKKAGAEVFVLTLARAVNV